MSYQSLFKIYVSDYSNYNEIYYNRFHSEASIMLPLTIHDNQAFFFMHNDISKLLSELYLYDKKIATAFNNLPNVAKTQYIKKSLIDEIHFTNEIEGVLSTRKDINNILESINVKNKERLVGIINKYNLLSKNSKSLTIKTALDVRKLYDEMLAKEIELEDKKNLPDGEIFRKDRVHVYSNSGKIIHEGLYPENNIIKAIEDGLIILNDESIDVYIRVAIFHYLFAYIHPFYDGNGRMARFISSYILSLNATPIISYRLSMVIKENLTQYFDAFRHTNDVRNKGDVSTFVYEFLSILLKAYQKTEMYALEKKQELDRYYIIIDKLELSKRCKDILYILVQTELFSEFGLSKREIQEKIECSSETCYSNLKILIDMKLINVIKNGKWLFYTANLENFI